MERTLTRMRRIARSSCFRDGIKKLAVDNGIIIDEIVLPFHEVTERLKSEKWVETITRDAFAITIVVLTTRFMWNENDTELIPVIAACYEKLAGLDLMTGAEMSMYHTLRFLLSTLPQPVGV